MNATFMRCSILAGIAKRPKSALQLALAGRSCSFSHLGCYFVGNRDFHNRQRMVQPRQWPRSSSVILFSTQKSGESKEPELTADEDMKKMGLVARFKKMYKEYWYVLLPAHIVTSAVWFGCFYYVSTR